MNNLALATAVLTSPTAAFSEVRERPRILFPLLLVLVATMAQLLWYYSVVDIAWLKDQMFTGNARFDAMPPEARGRMLAAMTKNTMMWPSMIAVAFMIPLIYALLSAYYLLAGKITNVQYSFKQWFALNAWSSMPMVIGLIAGCVILFMGGANAQVGPSELQVLSLNELFFRLSPAHPGSQLLMQLNPITIWTWCISIVGVKSWSNRSWAFAAMFVLLPVVVIYGAWAAIAF